MAPRKSKKKRQNPPKPVIVPRDPKLFYTQPFNFNYVPSDASLFRTKPYTIFEAAFSTNQYIFMIYRFHEDSLVGLARFCKTTHTWKFLANLPTVEDPYFCGMLWDQHTVLIYCDNRICSLDLKTFVLQEVDTNMISTYETGRADEVVINVERSTVIEFICQTVDKESRCIYVQARVYSADEPSQLCIYKLDWETKQWNKLNLVENNDQQIPVEDRKLAEGEYMAFWDGQLILGFGDKQAQRAASPWNNVRLVYNRVICIDISTLEWKYHNLNPHIRENNRQVRQIALDVVKWAQIGPTVYCVGTFDPLNYGYPKNDLWSLHLPSLTWTCHQESTILDEPLKSYFLVGSETDLWVMQQYAFYQTFENYTSYQIPLSTPSLHSMARSAFLARAPDALVKPRRMITRKLALMNIPKIPITFRRIKEFMQENGFNPDLFRLHNLFP